MKNHASDNPDGGMSHLQIPPDKQEQSTGEEDLLGPFPVDSLPSVMRRVVESNASTFGVDPALPALTALATTSGSLGRAWAVADAAPGHSLTFGNLYALCSAPRSYGKSAIAKTTAPLTERSAMLNQIWQENLPEWATQLGITRKMIDKLRKTYAEKVFDWDEETKGMQLERLEQLERARMKLQASLQSPPKYVTGNSTSAALTEDLAENDETLALINLEAGEMIASELGRQPMVDLLVSGYSSETYLQARIGRGSKQLRPCLTVLLMCQPTLLRDLLNRVNNQGRGLLARFLIVNLERNVIPQEGPQESGLINQDCGWKSFIESMLAFRMDNSRFLPVPCSAETREVFRHFHNRVVTWRNSSCAGFEADLGRARENAIRISLSLCLADHPGNFSNLEITADVARRAVKIAEWFLKSSVRLLSELDQGKIAARKEKLFSLLRGNGHAMSFRDLKLRHCFHEQEIERICALDPNPFEIKTIKKSTRRPSRVLVIKQPTIDDL